WDAQLGALGIEGVEATVVDRDAEAVGVQVRTHEVAGLDPLLQPTHAPHAGPRIDADQPAYPTRQRLRDLDDLLLPDVPDQLVGLVGGHLRRRDEDDVDPSVIEVLLE